MPMRHMRRLVLRLRDQRGVSLIEMLVAMLAGAIVIGALVVILEITINETSRIDETAQVNQAGRQTMTKIVDEIQSACFGREFAPVQGASTNRDLRFVTAFSKEANIKATEAAEHEIVWNESSQTLTEYKYAGANGENAGITFNATKESAAGTRIGEKITRGESGGSKTPIFRYYKYNSTATGGTEAPEDALVQIKPATETTTLGTAAAKEVAAVVITFKTGVHHEELIKSETKARNSLPSELSDQVTFAFAAPSSESTIKDGPCR